MPLVTIAQEPGKTYRVAILARAESVANLRATSGHRNWRVWHQELQRLGYAEGQNLIVERRSVEGDLRRLPELVRYIVQWRPDAVFAPNQDGAEAFKAATATIPVVAITSDPVRSGLAASLARPGGNVTGFSMDAGAEIFAKRMALLKEHSTDDVPASRPTAAGTLGKLDRRRNARSGPASWDHYHRRAVGSPRE
jgi:putative tryptophan/tyrosine transport system substrate-binding protein